MDPLNRKVSSSLEGIDTEDGLLRLKMILMADDVIATVADEKDADTFHKLISEFESISNLRLNPSKSITYGTVGAHNKVIKNWDIPIKKTTDDQFIYLGVPLNKVNWNIELKKLVNRISPLWDKALEVRTLYINTYVFSTLYYIEQHHSCPPSDLLMFQKSVLKKIQPGKGFSTAVPKLQTPTSFFTLILEIKTPTN
ncbi:unnamed protein product [Ambrosiozyma monospora]|uniref:Unnamed protein product n=1 Tax=Ambrosiozyma monospora TaxID=43982 RepID=A0ACB5TBH4_AMBMO|nr:unnamed protein product [Ambrosiozyma monospora]